MANLLKVACVQITSGPNILENLENVAVHVRAAAADGAELVATPENTCHLRFPAAQKRDSAFSQSDHTAVPFFSNLAKELGITLLIGSMAIKGDDGKILNRSFVFAKDGSLVSTYDKIHLFDVQLPTGESHCESDVMSPGCDAVVSRVNDDFALGLSICYDLRFAYLYRDMAKAGANIMCMPAAFTVPTGQAHWEVLLRARAIEIGSYVIAPAQVGEHEGGRKTYGHTLIIGPWGRVLAQKEHGEGFVSATLDLNEVETARAAIPALVHDRTYKVQVNE